VYFVVSLTAFSELWTRPILQGEFFKRAANDANLMLCTRTAGIQNTQSYTYYYIYTYKLNTYSTLF